MLPQQYCLRWKYHHSNLQTMFSQLLDRGCFCDVTLACEGQLLRAHRVVLCACSTFFDTLLTNYASERDPIIIMKDVTFADIKCLIEFMYKGEINVEHANLASLLKTADDLKIKGLAEVTWRDEEDGPPLPPAQTEFLSPTLSRSREPPHYDSYGHEAAMRSQTPELLERNNKTPSPRTGSARMPSLTPIGTSANAVSIVAAVSPSDTYLGPKRKRGRPPLDDAYDVFNVRKYADQGDHQSSFMDSSQYTRDDPPMHNNHHHVTTHHSRPNSPSAAEVYQHHVQQQKQRMRYKPQMRQEKEFNEEESTAEPEWITSSMEPDNAAKDPLNHEEDDDVAEDVKILPHDSGEESSSKKNEKRVKDSAAEHPKVKALKRKNSKEESSTIQRPPKTETPEEFLAGNDVTTVPQTVEEMESRQQQQQQQPAKEKSPAASTSAAAAANTSTSASTATSSSSASSPSASTSPTTSAAHKTSSSASSSSSTGHSSHHHSSAASGSSNSNHHGHHTAVPPPPPPLHHPHSHPHHYGKYVPDGYLVNEHGILMTHDFIHAPTATIPTSTGAASNGNHHAAADDYGDIKLEEFSEAELRLTTEEMSQWQDVIKMDDYLAKGRRPQFWEEPFTRRVLDAIKNKRLEMKKAARILGVSYGTLYGRYREVYGCLKHPYSSSSMRPSQSSALQHRFDIVWPAPKPGQLDIGKLRPKDLSELWTRPQI